jgi:plastocyanin
MKQRIFRAVLESGCIAIAAICLTAQGLFATTHVVQFGGTLGLAYSPTSFSASVGDTVKWEGDFSVHPLSSTTIPATAQAWHSGSGANFVYVIKVAGSYHYQCDIHVGLGMTGSFTATESSVRYIVVPPVGSRAQEIQLGVSEVSGMPFIKLTVTRAQPVTIKIFDFSGRELATIADRAVSAGVYSIPVGAARPASGFYFVKLSSNGLERVSSFFLSK